ncbi:hypothetical protein J6590_074081 [Homalodisca vitripennis]|nr:hypothetical protein J6590_074081 [Homalodisca vitripennis]
MLSRAYKLTHLSKQKTGNPSKRSGASVGQRIMYGRDHPLERALIHIWKLTILSGEIKNKEMITPWYTPYWRSVFGEPTAFCYLPARCGRLKSARSGT